MIIDNLITLFGVVFLIVLFVKAKKDIKEIEQSRANIEKTFLHLH